MSAEMIDGKKIAEQIHQETKQKVEALKSKGIHPFVAFIRIGDDPASRFYVSAKDKKAKELGLIAETYVYPEKITEQEVIREIQTLNQNKKVHGFLVQSPLPSHISETKIFSSISPDKDIDGFHPINVGKLLLGDLTGFRSCTPAGIHELLIRSNIPTEGKEVMILGRGNIVGKPMAAILCQKQKNANATVTILHSRTHDIPAHTRRADILIAAMGQPEFVKADMVKPGAVVIDVGINRVDDPKSPKGYRLAGDVDFESVRQVASKITPVPGGVGPMTIAILLANTVRAAEAQNNL